MKMNPVVHFEMPYEDKERMAKFYAEVFGWKSQFLGPEMGEYVVVETSETDEKRMVKKPGMINGGFYKKPENKLGHCPSVVIAVEDIKESLKKIEQAGGKIMNQPDDIPGIGLYSSFVDSEGNRMSVLQPSRKM